jgi:hypothetical protein
MTETREQMEARHAAERAALEAREALERDPWKDAIDAYWKELGVKPNEIKRADTRKGLIAAAPLMPVQAMGEGEIEALARECAETAAMMQKHVSATSPIVAVQAAKLALARVPVAAWPGEAELREMATEVAIDIRRKPGGHKFDEAALEMARRLRAHMTTAGADQ